MRPTQAALLGTIAALSLVAGCANDDTADAPPVTARPAATTPAPTTPTPTPAGVPPRQTGEGSGGHGLVLVDVRAASTERSTRVVLEFSGTGSPGWVVGYADEAVTDGSGEVVDLDAGSVLDVYARGTTAPAPDDYDGPRRITPRGDGVVPELYVVGTFEGDSQVLVGVDGEPAPFRVSTLTSPPRLVVEVLDAGD